MATLYLFCGKIASGKSTLASALEKQNTHIRLNEDEWLSTLYPNEINTPQDFKIKSDRLEALLKRHLVQLLKSGISVVLDFHANTHIRRKWMMDIIKESNCEHALHFFDISNEECKRRLRQRNATGEHAYQASDEMFDQFAKYFETPSKDEGFKITLHVE